MLKTIAYVDTFIIFDGIVQQKLCKEKLMTLDMKNVYKAIKQVNFIDFQYYKKNYFDLHNLSWTWELQSVIQIDIEGTCTYNLQNEVHNNNLLLQSTV